MLRFIKGLACRSAYVLATCWAFFVIWASPTWAQIPRGEESYLSRPNILEIEAEEQSLGENWEDLKSAHFAFVAQLLEFYPEGTHFYFLGRDAEYLFDVAQLVTQTTHESERIHLINVSRMNMRHELLKPYLNQNGISEESIRGGKKIVLIDTGFSGTIPKVIGELFPESMRSQIKTHLIVSSNIAHPSSRLFLAHLNPESIAEHPSTMHGTIVSYERMPRYTDRSRHYVIEGGLYHPVSPVNGNMRDGLVSKAKALQRMKDLKLEWQKPQIKKEFFTTRRTIQNILYLLSQGRPEDINELKQLLQSDQKTFVEAIIRDAFDLGGDFNVSIESLNLNKVRSSYGETSKKAELIKKYPSWAQLLEDPETEIPKLFSTENWQMIGNLIDINVDSEINRILFNHLYDAPSSGVKRELQIAVIEKADPTHLNLLASYIFSNEKTEKMTDLLQLMIEKADQDVLLTIATETFSHSHTSTMEDQLKILIKRGNQEVLAGLAQFVFSEPHTKNMTDLLRLVIKKAKGEALTYLATYTFASPHTKDMSDLLRRVVEKADQNVLVDLAKHTFSKPHTKNMSDILALAIEKSDQYTLAFFMQFTFTAPHTQDMLAPLRVLIERANVWSLQTYASPIPFLNKPQNETHKILRDSLSIRVTEDRKAWLKEKLDSGPSPSVCEKLLEGS